MSAVSASGLPGFKRMPEQLQGGSMTDVASALRAVCESGPLELTPDFVLTAIILRLAFFLSMNVARSRRMRYLYLVCWFFEVRYVAYVFFCPLSRSALPRRLKFFEAVRGEEWHLSAVALRQKTFSAESVDGKSTLFLSAL